MAGLLKNRADLKFQWRGIGAARVRLYSAFLPQDSEMDPDIYRHSVQPALNFFQSNEANVSLLS